MRSTEDKPVTEEPPPLLNENKPATEEPQPKEPDNSYLTRHLFGNFVFGTATAAYQVEGGAFAGGRGPSIWDHFTLDSPHKIDDKSNGNVACDTYTRYKEDIRMMKEMGFDAYRFSISWSRILPTGKCADGINQDGIDYYNDVIDTVIANGMKPFVTLFHFDTPLALQEEYGGFMSKNIIDHFREYAEICFWEFGDRVKCWTTINEPWTYAVNGYVLGIFPPGIQIPMPQVKPHAQNDQTSDQRQTTFFDPDGHLNIMHAHGNKLTSLPTLTVLNKTKDNTKEPTKKKASDSVDTPPPSKVDPKDVEKQVNYVYVVAKILLLAHAEAVHSYRKKFKALQGGEIGIVLNPFWYVPLHENSKEDQQAVITAIDFTLGWFLEPLLDGEYPLSMVRHIPKHVELLEQDKERLKNVPESARFSIEEQKRLKNSIDFLGVNYYTTNYVSHVAPENLEGEGYMADGQFVPNPEKAPGPISTGSDWLCVVPQGLYYLLVYMNNTYYPKIPHIYITENGYSDADDWKRTPRQACADPERTKYHQDHLAYILKAINEEGVDVRGYFLWSWCDNFEWSAGYKSRFGITYIDYKNNLARHPKDSARWFTKFLKKSKRPLLQKKDDKYDEQDEIKGQSLLGNKTKVTTIITHQYI